MSTPFGDRLGWGTRPALLLVDVVRAYLAPGSPFDLGGRGSTALAECLRLLDAARTGGVPVVHTVVGYAPGMADAAPFGRKVPALEVFADDATQGWGALTAELAPASGELVVRKQHASAFFGTSLAATLTSLGVDTVVLAGFSTSGCVRASTTDASAHGFVPVVVGAACGDRTSEVHEANLHDLDAKYADVVDVDDATTHLRGADV